MELATALIWTMRIVLPTILFFIYFKLQAPKEQKFAGPTGHVYPRAQLIPYCRAPGVPDAPKPQALQNLVLKDQAQAPELFTVSQGRADRNYRPQGTVGGVRRKLQEQKVEPLAAPDVEKEPALPVEEDKMHLESLLNYVAFHSKEQQRTFCVDDAPPPPPPKTKTETARAGKVAAASVSGAAAEKPNIEAQMVLQGAIDFKRVDIAKDIYGRLVDSHVEISARSFTLMIEACVLATDLKSASDFLMKMETAGHTPEPELLDKVMDLYSKQKMQREREQDIKDGLRDAAAKDSTAPRVKLSPSAPVFVPSFGIPPPPPKAQPSDEEDGEGSAIIASREEKEGKEAKEGITDKVPGSGEPPPEEGETGETQDEEAGAAEAVPDELRGTSQAQAEPSAEQPQRTKLVASAKPFEPQFGGIQYVWNANIPSFTQADAAGIAEDAQGKGKWNESSWQGEIGWDSGKGKGKFKGKGSGKWKGKFEYKGDHKAEYKSEYKGEGKGDSKSESKSDYKGDYKDHKGDCKGDHKGDFWGEYKGDYKGRGKGEYKGDGKGEYSQFDGEALYEPKCEAESRMDWKVDSKGRGRGKGRAMKWVPVVHDAKE